MIAFYLVAAAALALAWGGYLYWARRVEEDIVFGAEVEWKRFEAQEPEFIAGLSREKFGEIFRRAQFPRFPKYALACVSVFIAATPFIFALLTALMHVAIATGLAPEPVEVADRVFLDGDKVRIFSEAPPEVAIYYAQDLGGFYYFFGLAIAWLALVYVFVRRFYKRRPGYLRDEIIRAR